MAFASKGALVVCNILLLIFSLSCASHSLTTERLNQGDKLNSSSRLISENGLFQLKFDGNYLGIWHVGNHYGNPVWLANRNTAVSNNTGVLTIDTTGKLKILRSGGDPLEIYSNNEHAANLTAVLQNSGNFVLQEADTERVLWESFDHPTDTLLPEMKLGINHKTGKKWSLISRLGEDHPIPGAFSLEWEPEERQLVVSKRGKRFWTGGRKFENTPLLDPWSKKYNITVVSNENESYMSYTLYEDKSTSLPWNNFSMWHLDYAGNIFDLLGGRMMLSSSFCDGNNTESGCEKWDGPKCRRDGDKFAKRAGVFGIGHQHDIPNKSLSQSDCKDLCWANCSCTGVSNTLASGSGCLLYDGTFYDNDLTGDELNYFIILPGPPPRKVETWMWIVISVALSLLVAFMGMWVYLRWRRLKLEEKFLKELMTPDRENDANVLEESGGNGPNLQIFSTSAIKAATSNFSLVNKLGEGGFGPVYKGKLAEGQEIAVKRLSSRSGQGLVEFKNELILIAKLQHSNLVRLLGFSVQGEEKMLIYEYMPNKSLDHFIFATDPSRRVLLDWNKRFDIIEGIAQGLLYLHKHSRLRIIHRDLKAGNILLDKDLNPKISDFGLARIFMADAPEATNKPAGTYGYMPPEYAMQGIFSVKSDVYSFGVLVLETVSGRKNNGVYSSDRPLNLVGHAWEQWKVDPLKLLDPALSHLAPEGQVLRCINVGLLCAEHDPQDRPTMSDVVLMLKADVHQLPEPKQPAFYARTTSTAKQNSGENKIPIYSVNGLSLSAMDGR